RSAPRPSPKATASARRSCRRWSPRRTRRPSRRNGASTSRGFTANGPHVVRPVVKVGRDPVRGFGRLANGRAGTRRPPCLDDVVKVLVMGVVNVTPDSFSGDGELDPDAAIAHGKALAAAGADILDIGGEATNPKAKP